MDLPIEIKNKIEEIASEVSTSSLKACAKRMSDVYLNKARDGSSLLGNKSDVYAYAICRMPATYASISEALQNGIKHIPDSIESILDLGSGTGSSYFAFKNFSSSFSFTFVEREKEMINFAQKIIEDNIHYLNLDYTKSFPKEEADLVLASYTLNEIKKDNLSMILDKIWDASNKYILIVESGTKEAFELMKLIRSYYINKGGCVIAPCPHQNICPIVGDNWCHFQTRVQRSKLHKLLKDADVPYEDEKYTYLFISKIEIKTDYKRVLRHPLINNGFVSLNVCDATGIKDITITKKDKETYKKARKLGSGDCL